MGLDLLARHQLLKLALQGFDVGTNGYVHHSDHPPTRVVKCQAGGTHLLAKDIQ